VPKCGQLIGHAWLLLLQGNTLRQVVCGNPNASCGTENCGHLIPSLFDKVAARNEESKRSEVIQMIIEKFTDAEVAVLRYQLLRTMADPLEVAEILRDFVVTSHSAVERGRS